jgi:anti-sigma B factor antagonist
MSFKAMSRDAGDVTVIDMDGRITLGEGSDLLRELIDQKLRAGRKKIVMNLAEINYIDSTGLGELVSVYRQMKAQGGELKLLNLNKKVSDLLQITKLYAVFDVHTDEAQAVASFRP